MRNASTENTPYPACQAKSAHPMSADFIHIDDEVLSFSNSLLTGSVRDNAQAMCT
jgi:hypothetical protein